MMIRLEYFGLILLAMAMLLFPTAAMLWQSLIEGQPVLVVTFFGTESAAIVYQSGGQVVGPWKAPFAILAIGLSGFFAQLKENGSVMVLNGKTLSSFCGELA